MKNKVLVHTGILAAIIGFSLACISGYAAFFPEAFLLYKGDILTHLVYWDLCLYLIWLVLKKPTEAYLVSPKITAVLPNGVVLVRDAPWLSMHVSVSVYFLEGEFERLLCSGRVLNVQSNHLVQIELLLDGRGMSSISEVLETLQKNELERVLVKPGLFVEQL